MEAWSAKSHGDFVFSSFFRGFLEASVLSPAEPKQRLYVVPGGYSQPALQLSGLGKSSARKHCVACRSGERLEKL